MHIFLFVIYIEKKKYIIEDHKIIRSSANSSLNKNISLYAWSMTWRQKHNVNKDIFDRMPDRRIINIF